MSWSMKKGGITIKKLEEYYCGGKVLSAEATSGDADVAAT